MITPELTTLWKSSFKNPQYADNSSAAEQLAVLLIKMRSRAEHLVSIIRRDAPELTVHDVSHLDALWETASLAAGINYPLNPAEAFVLGAAILLHDSAMSLAAFPGGLKEIQETIEWRDAVAAQEMSVTSSDSELNKQSDTKIAFQEVLLDFLRQTHARQAGKLAEMSWLSDNGSREYLIEDSDIREYYGDIIGKIAASHWWPVPSLQKLPKRFNSGPGVPAEWYIEPLKLAALLRVADAAHIDHRRAPRFLRSLIRPKGKSEKHWTFQAKIGKPSLDKNYLVYTGGPFDVSEAEAWWLGFDMLTSIDEELRSVQGLLDVEGLHPFVATGVKGAKSPTAIAGLISTRNWTPVNTELRVTNVPALVEMLGGQRLYGSDLAIALREIIQNGTDAIRARACFEKSTSFRVIVRIKRYTDYDVLEVEDNGIGMSRKVLTETLLDFGRSFWRSESLRNEFPGLLSSGLKTTGRFGIGFFSIFMLGDQVTVTSRRYNDAVKDTNTLQFQRGLHLRPILRETNNDELLLNGGTKVSVKLNKRCDEPGGLLHKCVSDDVVLLEAFSKFVAHTAPSSEVTIIVEIDDQTMLSVAADDWLSKNPKELAFRVAGNPFGDMANWRLAQLGLTLESLRLLKDAETGEIYGRACLNIGHSWIDGGVLTVGGFRASSIRGLAGILKGEPETVVRQSAMPTVPGPVLRKWAEEQAELIRHAELSDMSQLHAADVIMSFGVAAINLPIAVLNEIYLKADILETILASRTEVNVYIGLEITYEIDDDIRPSAFKESFLVDRNLLMIPRPNKSVAEVGDRKWPQCITDLYTLNLPVSCEDAIRRILEKIWGRYEVKEETSIVGMVEEDEIKRKVLCFRRLFDS